MASPTKTTLSDEKHNGQCGNDNADHSQDYVGRTESESATPQQDHGVGARFVLFLSSHSSKSQRTHDARVDREQKRESSLVYGLRMSINSCRGGRLWPPAGRQCRRPLRVLLGTLRKRMKSTQALANLWTRI